MSAFDLAELRRLSEAATKEDWTLGEYPVLDFVFIGDSAKILAEATYRRDAKLIAYLGTHREAILRRLEAADEMTEAGEALFDRVCGDTVNDREAMDAWISARTAHEKAKGA